MASLYIISSLGFQVGSITDFGAGPGDVLIARVLCDGHESSLAECENGTNYVNPNITLPHDNDVGVKCYSGET